MSIATTIADIPTGFLVVIGLLLAAFAVRFRGIVTIAVTGLLIVGTWASGQPRPGECLFFGALVYAILSIVAGIFGGGTREGDDAPAGGYSYADEQARLASEYHRRERESRF
ncbi:hypothetical protein GS397_27545 (plasmid) [Sphingobium yanoikuyae]|jgi:hypothetical protein|uniref:Uncharacterized protein n=1 Tax=Sphingobium yanoikuyae TaxID=13690 RepID=A0A6P1GQX4_SPHYA|nr:hypothetical protein [Sphingobium yanoikuyae]QHD70858.1 hypothetical protein GS397_27545 [Sphingobium yanoikuyae]SCW95081.1 hypothetical protein SAMN02927924_04632 [Sphingobium faniae]